MARGIRLVGAGVGADELDTQELPPTRRAAEKKASSKAKSRRTLAKAVSGRAAGKVAASAAPAIGNREDPPSPPQRRAAAKLWAGRLDRTAPIVEVYTASFDIDRRLYAEDIEGSQAHAAMLRSVGLLKVGEWKAIESGLRAIRREFERGTFIVDSGDEDIHSAIERRLHDHAGDVAGKLHTGRSRNDQIATDLRLYTKRACRDLMLAASTLQEVLLRRAREHRGTLMPGYTHGQRAQVISLAHHLLAYTEMLQRDVERFADAHDRCDVLPLGAGALAGSTLPLDRELVAATLDFDAVSGNSMDAVADRDFVVETVFACALTMAHLSRLGEEIVQWCSTEYGFAELPDAYSTGSSLMPQKKNPDVVELARGRSSRVLGDLVSLLSLLKGLPLAYNRDLQEDKRPFFDAVDVTTTTLQMLAEVIGHIGFDVVRMREAASDPALVATDIAEWLVLQGVPFREAHGIVARTVKQAVRQHRRLDQVTLAQWRAIDGRVQPEMLELFDIDRRLARRELPGGPGPRAVSRQLVRIATLVARNRRRVTVMARNPRVAKEVGGGRSEP